MNQLAREARALCRDATDGPWHAGRADMGTFVDGYESKWIYAGEPAEKSKYLAVSSGYEIKEWDEVMANAHLITRSRTLLPEMAEGIERLQAELDAAKRDIRHVLGVEQYDVCDICAYNHDENYLCDDCTKAKWRGLCSENSAEALAAMKEDAHVD